VARVTKRVCAISGFERPSAASRQTRRSLGVSAAAPLRTTPRGRDPTARAIGARDGQPLLEHGRVLDVANVIWCTGFEQDFSWIEMPVAGDDGWPLEERGVVPSAPGLYFTGLAFQYSFSSMLILGAGRDAEYVAKRIVSANGRGRG
jgi:hypothetical protein